MPPRLYSHEPLASGQRVLDAASARHARVLRLDTGDALTLFDGRGGEWPATVVQTRKDAVIVDVGPHAELEREHAVEVHLAVGMPANDRMDVLVEKATELGAASIQPLLTERSVLRLHGDRAARKVTHWQAVAIAACEQCGRNRVPPVAAPITLSVWLADLDARHARDGAQRWLLCAPRADVGDAGARDHAPDAALKPRRIVVLSGPEGGLSADEHQLCLSTYGFAAHSLGPRVLRAETAPLALLASIR